MSRMEWDPEADDHLRANWADTTDAELAARFGATERQVVRRRHKLRLLRGQRIGRQPSPRVDLPEEWAPVRGWSGYEVSSHGRVRRLGHVSPRGRYLRERILRPRGRGRRVDLFSGDRRWSPMLHQVLPAKWDTNNENNPTR